MYDSTDIATTARNFSTKYQILKSKGLPSPLLVQQLAMTTPYGKAFALAFFWGSDDHEQGKEWLEKIVALGDVVMNTVAPSTLADFLESLRASVPPSAYGSIETMSIRELTPEAIEIVARNIERMPATMGTAFSIHELRGPSAIQNADSVFGSREPHMMLELITAVGDRADLKGAQGWAASFFVELKEMNSRNILPGTYISLTPPGSNSFENIFGNNYKFLVNMKHKWDPERLFALAPPEID